MLEKRRDWSPSGYLLFEIRQSEWPPIDRNLRDLVLGFQLSALLEYNNYRKLTRGKKKRIRFWKNIFREQTIPAAAPESPFLRRVPRGICRLNANLRSRRAVCE